MRSTHPICLSRPADCRILSERSYALLLLLACFHYRAGIYQHCQLRALCLVQGAQAHVASMFSRGAACALRTAAAPLSPVDPSTAAIFIWALTALAASRNHAFGRPVSRAQSSQSASHLARRTAPLYDGPRRSVGARADFLNFRLYCATPARKAKPSPCAASRPARWDSCAPILQTRRKR